MSLLWSTPCNLLWNPISWKMNQQFRNVHNITIVPMKLNLQNNKSNFEITFDYDIKRDKEIDVAQELWTALNLPNKYTKPIAKQISIILTDKLFLTDILILMNKQMKQHMKRRYHRLSTGRRTKKAQGELKQNIWHRNSSVQQADKEKLPFEIGKRKYSFNNSESMKLFEDSHYYINYIDHDDVNSRRSKLNNTANERYQAWDINNNMFNIYEYHNSFTASSVLKHSNNTFLKGKFYRLIHRENKSRRSLSQ